jgi:hypothetical protein
MEWKSRTFRVFGYEKIANGTLGLQKEVFMAHIIVHDDLHVPMTYQKKNHTKCWLENLKGRYHSENLGVDGKIILKRIFG